MLGRAELRGAAPQVHHRHDRHQQRQHGWQQPTEPPLPEPQHVHGARAPHLIDQQSGDEEAREREEQIDAEETAAEASVVEEEHADDGEAAQPVEGENPVVLFHIGDRPYPLSTAAMASASRAGKSRERSVGQS